MFCLLLIYILYCSNKISSIGSVQSIANLHPVLLHIIHIIGFGAVLSLLTIASLHL